MSTTPNSDTITGALALMAEASAAMQRAMGVQMRTPSMQYHAWTSDVDVMLALVDSGARVSIDAGVSVAVSGADGVRAVVHAYGGGDERARFIADCPVAALRDALHRLRPTLPVMLTNDLDAAQIRALVLSEVTR